MQSNIVSEINVTQKDYQIDEKDNIDIKQPLVSYTWEEWNQVDGNNDDGMEYTVAEPVIVGKRLNQRKWTPSFSSTSKTIDGEIQTSL